MYLLVLFYNTYSANWMCSALGKWHLTHEARLFLDCKQKIKCQIEDVIQQLLKHLIAVGVEGGHRRFHYCFKSYVFCFG